MWCHLMVWNVVEVTIILGESPQLMYRSCFLHRLTLCTHRDSRNFNLSKFTCRYLSAKNGQTAVSTGNSILLAVKTLQREREHLSETALKQYFVVLITAAFLKCYQTPWQRKVSTEYKSHKLSCNVWKENQESDLKCDLINVMAFSNLVQLCRR